MERLVRAALAATLTILLVAGGSLALTQAGPDDLATLQAAPWTLSELDGQSVSPEAGVTATFGADGSLTGSAGCNTYSGDYQVTDEFLGVGPLASTRMACEPDVMDTENLFLDLLQNADTWALDGSALIITSLDGSLLVFGGDSQGEPARFTETEWTLEALNGIEVSAAMGITIVFATDFSVTGFAGCNDYTGDYAIRIQLTTPDGDEGSMSIGPLAATRKACEPDVMDIENAFLGGVEQVERFTIIGQTLTLSGPDSSTELVLSAGGGEPDNGELAGVLWSLVDLDGQPARVDDGMVVTFGEDGSIDGFGGCNEIFGSYRTNGTELIIDGLAATRRFCDDALMDRESLYIGLLTTAIDWQVLDDELFILSEGLGELIFTSGDPAIPTPTPAPTETPITGDALVGPVWQLVELQGQAIPTSLFSVTISFAADGTVSGNGGCNDFTGSYVHEGTSISVADISPGTAECDASIAAVEQGLLQLLPFVDTAEIVDGELHLDSSFGIQSVWTPS